MQKMIFMAALCIGLLYLPGCGMNNKETSLNEIDIRKANEIEFNDLVDDITSISIDGDNPEGFFTSCDKIIHYSNRIFIYSLSRFAVFVYSDSGQFIKRIDNRSKGKVETPSDILIDEDRNLLLIVDGSLSRLLYFTLDGEFIEEKKLEKKAVSFVHLSGDHYLAYDGRMEKSFSNYISIYNQSTGEMENRFIRKLENKKLNEKYSSSLFSRNNARGEIYVLPPYSSTIYISDTIDGTTFCPYLSINTGGDFLSEDKFPDKGFSEKEFADIMHSKKQIYSITDFKSASNQIFFKLNGKDSNYYSVNLNNHEVSRFPFLYDGLESFSSTRIQGSSDEYLIALYTKESVMKYVDKQPNANPQISECLKKTDSNDKWILFFFKIKSNR